MKTNKKTKTENISLSFDLTSYLIDHPGILTEYKNEGHVVIFVKNDNTINKRSEVALTAILKKGLSVIKATKTSNTYNKWNFESVEPQLGFN
jgi:hypothetical protein